MYLLNHTVALHLYLAIPDSRTDRLSYKTVDRANQIGNLTNKRDWFSIVKRQPIIGNSPSCLFAVQYITVQEVLWLPSISPSARQSLFVSIYYGLNAWKRKHSPSHPGTSAFTFGGTTTFRQNPAAILPANDGDVGRISSQIQAHPIGILHGKVVTALIYLFCNDNHHWTRWLRRNIQQIWLY